MREKLRSQRETVISLPKTMRPDGETARLDRYAMVLPFISLAPIIITAYKLRCC